MTTALRRIQIGKEATRGTAVAATKILLGNLTMNPTLNLFMPEDEARNSLALLHRREIVGQEATLRYDGPMTFDQLITFLAMGIKGGVTPTTPGGGTDSRDWTFLPTVAALNAQNAFTFEFGDDSQEYESAFVMCSQLELAYAMGEPVTLTADLFGHFPAKSTFTGALSNPANLEDGISQKTKIYSDTTYANLGTTQLSDTLVNATVRVPTGLAPVRVADGLLEFSTFSEGKRAAEVELTFVHNSTGIAIYDKYVSGALDFIRLHTVGSIIELAIPYSLIVDLSLRYTEAPEFFTDDLGRNVVRMAARTFEDPTSNNDMNFVVTNKETTL